MKNIILFFALTLSSIFFRAQTRTITGSIRDYETNAPLVGCKVFRPKSDKRILSDENGIFKIIISDKETDPIILIHLEGYKPETLKIKPDKNDYQILLKPKSVIIETVALTGATRATLIKENPISITAISTKQIERTSGSNVIDVLAKNVPGLAVVKTGPNISKPFIHGLGYNRVLTLYDGIRQEGQQYGDEHGLEVDDYNIARAEVIKGPASLLYGSDAIAGVISLFPHLPNQNDGKIHGKLTSEYQTNNNLIGNSLNLEYSNNRFVFALRGSYRMAKNYRNPIDGRVYLTNFNVRNFSALAGYKSSNGYTHLNFTLYNNNQGIPDGSRDSSTRKFTKQIFEGDNDDITNRPIVSDTELNSYKVPDLSQKIRHYRLYTHSFYEVGKGDIDFIFGLQQNSRAEYNHPSMPEQAGMHMRLNTFNYSFRYNAPKFANIETSFGINGMLQANKNMNATDFPIPDYNLYDGGVYLYAKWKKEKWSVSGGVRYDLRYVKWGDFYVSIDPATGFLKHSNANASKAELKFESYKKSFQGVSGSIGATFSASKNISFKANIGRAYRSPNITEIGSNGLDPGAHIIYLGNRNFKPEFSLQEDMGFNLNFKDFSADASFFNNNIQNYIYMKTVADAQGNPILDAQGNKTYQYQQSSAQLYGSEIYFTLHPKKLECLRWDNSFSVIYGFNRKSIYKNKGINGEYLPLIPPLKLTSGLSYDIKPNSKRLISLSPKFEVEYNAAQKRYLGLNGTETLTPSYTLFNLGLGAEIKYKKELIQIIVQANNLFNRAYQSHLNRLKYFEYYNQSPNGHLGIYSMGRNITMRIIFPF